MKICEAPATMATLVLNSVIDMLFVAKAIWPSKSINTKAWFSGDKRSGDGFIILIF
ncbi:hypothetical protein D3C86_2145280 [compost metagenome]